MNKSAHAWRSGEIGFREAGTPCPDGALPLPDAPEELIREHAEQACGGTVLLVPDLAEADDEDAVEVFEDFCDHLAACAAPTEDAA